MGADVSKQDSWDIISIVISMFTECSTLGVTRHGIECYRASLVEHAVRKQVARDMRLGSKSCLTGG